MIILKSWLKDYIDIPWSDDELIQKLTDSGSLVDSYYFTLDPNIVIAQIKEIKKHPNADKLRLALVSDGTTDKWVVCGASNIEAGLKVPLAKVGAKIGDIIIQEANIRGETSHGMLCSEFELGIGNNHEGILILPEESTLGQPLSSIYDSDLVLDIEITPNRGDCLSHLGIAREIASLLGKSISKDPISLPMSGTNISTRLSVTVSSPDLCPRYFARMIRGVKVAPSPEWLVKRLGLCGINSINNVVDVTNYIMLDLGQPLHAFDASKLADNKIIVRKARNNEEIITLDGEIKSLTPKTLVIADSKRAIAIAGIMGGEASGITNDTVDIILESAMFDRVSVRRSAKTLGLLTDASYRFERGIDPSNIEYSLNKAAKMIKELAGGEIIQGIAKYDSEFTLPEIEIKFDAINSLLGTNLSFDEIKKILKDRGFKMADSAAVAPSWRHDVTIWQDLAEEVMCVYGMNNISHTAVTKSQTPQKSPYFYKEYLKDLLVDLGFSEIFSYSFMSEADIKTAKLNSKDLLVVDNPISPENSYMRNSLIPGILSAISKNPTYDPVMLFEIGNVFTKSNESTKLCFAASGSNAEKSMQKALDTLTNVLKVPKEEASIQTLEREDLKVYKIKKPSVFYVEIDLNNIKKRMKLDQSKLKLSVPQKDVNYRNISKYPSVTRDLAFIINKDAETVNVSSAIYQVSNLIINVELFDEFASDRFGKNMKNIAFHIYLQAPDKTLKDDEADKIIKNVIKTIENNFKAKLRDK